MDISKGPEPIQIELVQLDPIKERPASAPQPDVVGNSGAGEDVKHPTEKLHYNTL